jgi:hypothetical protein
VGAILARRGGTVKPQTEQELRIRREKGRDTRMSAGERFAGCRHARRVLGPTASGRRCAVGGDASERTSDADPDVVFDGDQNEEKVEGHAGACDRGNRDFSQSRSSYTCTVRRAVSSHEKR